MNEEQLTAIKFAKWIWDYYRPNAYYHRWYKKDSTTTNLFYTEEELWIEFQKTLLV